MTIHANNKQVSKNCITVGAIALAASILGNVASAEAAPQFEEQPVSTEKMTTLISPHASGIYSINIIEQLDGQRSCLETAENQPHVVIPSLLNFDFTGHCKRYNSNAFSVYTPSQNMGYQLRVRPAGEELLVEAFNPFDRQDPTFTVGRAPNIPGQHLKVELDPAWSMNRRVFSGQPLNHLHFSAASSLNAEGIKPVQRF